MRTQHLACGMRQLQDASDSQRGTQRQLQDVSAQLQDAQRAAAAAAEGQAGTQQQLAQLQQQLDARAAEQQHASDSAASMWVLL
jgi:chromosome segregation ATPase